ncbi:MAG: PAS domain S-box protein [Methanocalculus sp. MSAO_Arc1]|uniref:PAS domain S-box protein n=1 Tax=Methanocalculus TaxID=71151 RepID=UPI000FF45040|nr:MULTISPECIES: PAS domain S-box protein [unclassified Methanocalculus]MCP1661429.1 PAS domain S-box-containing protein [Methanocalculus sp. AMF5]RQD80402.1 MAG: PAS domain S-box protein [Methanocalculus sp. MSAO_Arc1]
MENQQDEERAIHDLLKRHPNGLSVTEVAEALGRNKHSTGRYLASMYAAGQVEMRTFGKAKIYSLAYRVPLPSLIQTMSERIIILDTDLRVLFINQASTDFLGVSGDRVTGQDIRYLPVSDPAIHDLCLLLADQVSDTEQVIEHAVENVSGEITYLHTRIIPSFDDGHRDVYVIVMVDITDSVTALEALRESEQQYRELVEMAHAIILKLDVEGRILFFNEFAESFFGYSKEEVLGKSVIGTIVPPNEMTGRDLRDLIQKICTDTDRYRLNENANITKDGRLVWFRWSNRAILNEDGEVVGVLSVGNDITDRKEMELELLSRKEQLERRVREIECIHRFVSTLDSKSTIGEILSELVRVIGKCWSEQGTAAIRITYGEMVCESGLPDGLPFIFSMPITVHGTPAGQLEAGFGGREEDPEYYESKESLLAKFAARIGWSLEWMEAEQVARRERDLLHTLLSTVDAAIFVLDPKGTILRINRRTEELTGFLAEEVVGRHISELLQKQEEINEVQAHIDTLLEAKRSTTIRAVWPGKDGRGRTIEWSNSVICDESGSVTHIVSTGLDVTRQVEYEDELRRCRSMLDRLLDGEKSA